MRFRLALLYVVAYVQCLGTPEPYSSSYQEQLFDSPLAMNISQLDTVDAFWKRDLSFSSAAIAKLRALKAQFPDVFKRIRDTDGSTNVKDLFESQTELLSFLRFPREEAPIMMHYLSQCAMQDEAKILSQWEIAAEAQQRTKSIRIRCSPSLLGFWEPDLATVSPTEIKKVVPEIGDRLVVIGGNTVPFGMYAAVVAVHPLSHNVEIVTGQPFIGGTNLHGLLSCEGRGA